MRKSKLLAGVYGVYAVYDKISKHYRGLYFASNDADFIKLYLPSIILSIPLRDLQIFKIGIFNDITGEIKSTVKKRVSTDSYKFPHSRLSPEGEDLSLEEMEKELTETKNKILAESSISDIEEGEENE